MRTNSFTLHLDAEGGALPGYFPMGFVRGDPAIVANAGFSQVQDTSMAPTFVNGASYPEAPIYQQDPWGLRYYSLALPADSIQGLVTTAAKAGRNATAPTKGFGPLTLAVGPDGRPYSLPEFKTRDMAKVRDLVDVFDPATRRYLQAYVKAHVESRLNSLAGDRVQLWGLDNEWEAPLNYSPVARARFLEWLKQVYAEDIDGLNEAWQTSFERFDSSVTADLPSPADYRERPGAFLDWYEFSTGSFLHVMLEQVRAMHDADPQKRGVVHKATQLTLEMPATSRLRLFNHGRFANLIRPYSGGLYGIDMYGAGDRQAYETNYIFNSIRPEDRTPGFGVMLAETNNHGGPGHQFASTFWRLLANGAKSMMFFTPGFVGAPKGSDWDKFSMIDRETGRPKDRWLYAARWAAAVHRSERFWSEAVPAPDAPRVAMLMPRRDILLSERSERNPGEGRYAYPRNHRWMVYRWLREQGYWVDVLPYEKLTNGYLADYSALLLVGAEHLSSTECETVARYVAAGGILVADTAPGYFDPHHRVLNAFASPAGLAVQRTADLRPVSFDFGGRTVEGVTAYVVKAESARVLSRDAAGDPLALLQAFRKGRILSLPFELGSLVLKGKDAAVASLQSEQEPTAGAEQYAAYDDEFLIGEWLTGVLAQAGLRPAYEASYPTASVARIVRVEQPYVDAAGNMAVVIGNRAQLHPQEILPAGVVELPLPGGTWTHAFWAAAETDELVQIEVASLGDGRHRIALPSIASAGIVYLFREYTPLLGVAPFAAEQRRAAGETARVKPGVSFTLPVQLVNPTANPLPAGSLTVLAPAGWSVMPERAATPVVAAGEMATLEFTVTPVGDGQRLKPDWLYPLVTRWNDGKADRAIMTTHVEGAPEPIDIPRLLSGNATYPENYPYRVETGATYRYLSPAAAQIADPAEAGTRVAPGQALLGGFGSIAGERDSFNRSGYVKNFYARYDAPVVEILFDLQARREVMRVNFVNGPERVTPTRVEVFTSEDGSVYVSRGYVESKIPRTEAVLTLEPTPARWLKIRAEWPTAGGTLDEVEIWGR